MASVSNLFIYPVKSCGGVSVDAAAVLPHGLGLTVLRADGTTAEACVRVPPSVNSAASSSFPFNALHSFDIIPRDRGVAHGSGIRITGVAGGGQGRGIGVCLSPVACSSIGGGWGLGLGVWGCACLVLPPACLPPGLPPVAMEVAGNGPAVVRLRF